MAPSAGCLTERSRLWPAIAVALFSGRSGVVYARPPTPDFQFDPVEYWAARILAWGLMVAVVVVVYALVRAVRGRLSGARSTALMVLCIIVLPSFSVATGMLLVFIRAERVEFCGSCHRVMEAYTNDMTNAEGTGLAAIHYVNRYIPNNQCYECHTSYGLFGTAEAKIHGVAEVARYYTGTYELPISMWKPYRNSDCLKCHARSNKWLAVEAHVDDDTEQQLFEDRISCMSCHQTGHKVRDEAAGGGS